MSERTFLSDRCRLWYLARSGHLISDRRLVEGGRVRSRSLLDFSKPILIKTAEADRLIGKLDGITHTLPDVDFFLSMFVAKDAASSAQIEGTRATIVDAIEMNAGLAVIKTDADDIVHYIKALNYGIERLNSFPLSLRLIKEIHSQLMTEARASHFPDPGEFRKSQNWIGGTTLNNASFVPPTVEILTVDIFKRKQQGDHYPGRTAIA